jgi:hypothetical protein
MALSYDLEVTDLQDLGGLSEALVGLSIHPQQATGLGQFANDRFYAPPVGINPPVQDIFPTGEYIIRKGMYINGQFLFVGSYKAYCRDLFGAGNNGYAWDGFLMLFNGYNTKSYPLTELFNFGGSTGLIFGKGSSFLPMRMMFEVNPGPIGSATAIANDSEVGLYGMDFWKSFEDLAVLPFQEDINLILCGFQRIDPTVEGVPTGSDYVGNIYMGQFLKYQGLSENPDGARLINYGTERLNLMQITWRANQAGHTDNTLFVGRFGRIMDLDEWLGVVENVSQLGGNLWNFAQWFSVAETKPDTEKNAENCNVFPRRFYDITCVSQQPYTPTQVASSVFLITGDAALDINNDGSIDKTVPCIINGGYDVQSFLALDPALDQAPYLNMNPSGATSLSLTSTYSWVIEGGAGNPPTFSLDGAVAVFCSFPYEAISLTLPYPVQELPTTLIALNDVNNSGNTFGAIYGFNESVLYESQFVFALATEGGNMPTATGLQMPNQWYGKAVQQRTFTIQEENFGKHGILNPETGVFTPNLDADGIPYGTPSIFDNDAQEYIGFSGNYQRYGAFVIEGDADPPVAVPGQLTGAGYGFLGIRDGVGAIAVMFDSGSPIFDAVAVNLSMVVRGEGANISANCITNPSSATRKIIACGWDNDRDQWLFVASDTNQVSVISASSDFNTDTNNIGFLDQTANFVGLEANTDTGIYFPISMSNSLDGWVWFGALDSNGFGVQPMSYGVAVSKTVQASPTISITYDTYPNSNSQVKRITGTTGRTAKVWVDYILFDGPDAIIANKIKERGMKVSIEAVEWFKRSIIQSGDLNITNEEIELWMREQQDQYMQTLKDIERQGRLKRKKKQVSAYTEGIEEQINPDFMDSEVEEFMEEFTPETRPPTPEEERIERKKKGGYSPEQGSYYDEVFED